MITPRGSAKSSRAFLTPAQSLSGRYELLGRLGSGGMAEIYLARAVGLQDFEFEKIVVLKRVLPERMDDARYAAMFRDEARVAATLEHPNIVHTHDIGIKDDECFFTMEYLHGEDLKAILAAANAAHEQLPLELVLQIAVGCAAGLHHAHEQTDYAGRPLEIVHRDVSPSNIIVTRQSGVKLIDFGIAKATSDKEQTAVGVLKGKVAYMSPEQCRGEVLDRRSDIFALGIVLYEMVTMERPYRAGTVLGTVHKLLSEEPSPPRQLRGDCPPALERIVLRALEKDASKRYQTAFEMQEELELVTRDHQLHGLPGALGRYLEHLFGPKPHPWRQHAKRPPAVPRWAWDELDSTVTTPRQAPPRPALPSTLPRLSPMPVPQAHAPSDPAVITAPMAMAQAHAGSPSPTGAHASLGSPTPTGAHASLGSPTPTGAHASLPAARPTGPYVPVQFDNTYASEAPAELGSLVAAPVPSPPAKRWALEHLLIGAVVGGLVALGGLSLWTRASEPTREASPPSVAQSPSLETSVSSPPSSPSSSLARPLDPLAVAAPTPGSESPTVADDRVDSADDSANDSADDDTTLAPAHEPNPTTASTRAAARLLERARDNLLSNPQQAYRDAKESYDLHHTQTALQLMGQAACRTGQEPKALYAYRRLRGKAQRELSSSCRQLGLVLE